MYEFQKEATKKEEKSGWVSVSCIETGEDAVYHQHEEIEILYAMDGAILVGEEKLEVRSCEIAVINPSVPHKVSRSGKERYLCIHVSPRILCLEESGDLAFQYAAPFLLENAYPLIFEIGEIEGMDLPALFLEIQKEWEERGPAYELILRGNILKLFAGILRCKKESERFALNLQHTDAMEKAIAYIEENYSTATEKEVAYACGLSYAYFSHIFKKMMGRSFSEYLTGIKLREAEKLLLTSNKSVTEIALGTGFSTASHFISRFRKYRQLTPKQFREAVKNR